MKAMARVLNRRTDAILRDAVYVGRPSKWGNPFVVGKHGDREACVALYREWIAEPEQATLAAAAAVELAGKDLVCWCAPAACHAHVLFAIANP